MTATELLREAARLMRRRGPRLPGGGAVKPHNSALPVHNGPEACPTCWTPPGKTHELSCPEVSLEQMQAEFDRLREEQSRWDRRDRRGEVVQWVIVVAVALLLTALAFCGSVNR